MAKKKPRTPTPPRNVQAPQRRDTRAGSMMDDLGLKHRVLLYGISGAGIVALAVVVLVVALGGGKTNDQAVAAAMTSAGCNFRTVKAFVPAGAPTHVNSLTSNDHWNTDPPSNGQHYPQWAVWGFYTQPINPRMVVHNEEHGGVILWWGSKVPPATVAALQSFYDEQPDAVFGTPYAKLGSKIAITAWTGNPRDYSLTGGYHGFGHIGICSDWSPKVQAAFAKFRSVYRGHGPEGIPLCADEPGDSPTKSSC